MRRWAYDSPVSAEKQYPHAPELASYHNSAGGPGMSFTPDDVRRNQEYFAHKLHAEKQRNDVLKAVEGTGKYDFVLLDTRGREAFNSGHIPGAWCVPDSGIDQIASSLPKEKEIVTYCWSHD
jgi:3-mercaptopyruvate sulfurtransferase SseA